MVERRKGTTHMCGCKRDLRNVRKLSYLVAAAVLVVLGMSGCASTQDSDNASVRPWNAPKGWENGLPSTMQEGR